MGIQWRSPAEIVAAARRAAEAAAHKIVVTAKSVAGAARKVIPMPSSTKETEDALQAFCRMVGTMRNAMAEESPGGKSITLDEIVSGVSDGKVVASIQRLASAIQTIIGGGKIDPVDAIPIVSDALLHTVATLKDALKDKRVTADELLATVSDGKLQGDIAAAIDGIEKIPDELRSLDMWSVLSLFKKVSAWLPELLGNKS